MFFFFKIVLQPSGSTAAWLDEHLGKGLEHQYVRTMWQCWAGLRPCSLTPPDSLADDSHSRDEGPERQSCQGLVVAGGEAD